MKNLLILFAAVLLVSCSKDTEPTQNTDKEIAVVTQVLNGKFIGSLFSSSTNTTEVEELLFSPYASPKEEVSIIDGKLKIYGTAVVTKYTNDHLFEITHNCYYSVNVAYTGAQPTVSFYSYGNNGEINNREDKRIISILSNISFKMSNKTFAKQ